MEREKTILEMTMEHLSFSSDDTVTTETFLPSVKNFVNSALSTLRQNGVGVISNYNVVVDDSLTWSKFLGKYYETDVFGFAQNYLFTSVHLLFDPPNNSAATILEKYCTEMLWRAREEVEYLNGN